MEVHSQGQLTQRPSISRGGRWFFRAALLLFAGVTLWSAAKVVQFNPTDYVAWQNDWTVATHCIESGTSPCAGISKFPPAYLLNAGLVGSVEGADRSVLGAINLLSLLVPVFACLWLWGIPRAAIAIYPYAAAVTLSPLPVFYILSGALELQSAVFSGLYLGAFVLVLEDPRLSKGKVPALLLVLSGLIFPLYKDTIAPMAGLACILLLWLHRQRLKQWWQTVDGRYVLLRALLLASAPVICSVAILIAYNAFRYNTPIPLGYVEEARQTLPSLGKSAEFLAGSLFSPNGGALVFWAFPMAVALIGWRLEGWAPRRSALMGGAALLLLSVVSFARWWAPFGWDSWGDRLLIPPALALMVAALITLRPREAVKGVVQDRGPGVVRVGTALLGLALVFCSALYAAAPHFSPAGQAMPDSLWPGPACARMQQAVPEQALAEGMAFWKGQIYYECARERMLHIPAPRAR